MMSSAPSTTPGMLPAPPRMTNVNMRTDSQKVNDSGEMIVIFAANRLPAIPAQAAPSPNIGVL